MKETKRGRTAKNQASIGKKNTLPVKWRERKTPMNPARREERQELTERQKNLSGEVLT